MARTEQLSIYLLKPTIDQPTDALRVNAECAQVQLPATAPDGFELFTRCTPPHPPSWLRFFPQDAQQAIEGMLAASAGAILFVRSKDRLFAVCFGTGWHLLAKDSFVRNFGLRAALSLVKRGTLKSVDVSTYENFAKHRRVSTSKGTTIDSFDIEGQLDLLRGVVGECERSSIGTQIGGKDACVVWSKITFDKLHKLCSLLFAGYKTKRVENRYPVVNQVAEVRDPTETARLDSLLDAQIAANPGYDISIAPPEVVDWQNTATFRIDHGNAPASSIALDFAKVREMYDPSVPTCSDLRRVRVETVTPTGSQGPQDWTLYQCLVAEVTDPDDLNVRCILMAGDWYTVAASLVIQINQDLANFTQHAVALPNANAGETEGAYNARLATNNPATHGLLDAKTISYGGGRSRIEVCDVITANGCMYHVKDYHGSATLSHLFAQGTVSGRLLLEQQFRQEVINKHPNLVGNPIQPGVINPENMEVVYAIICEPGRAIPSDLPFFSKIRLVESARELRRMGYSNVSVAKITRI
jgi:uncharacterized protein (TIGR04141 family)